MKKYPVIYKGKEYEVRWEEETYCGMIYDYTIAVYEVKPYTSFFTHKNKLKYKKIDSYCSSIINKLYDLDTDDEKLYIKQAMYTVATVLADIEEETRKKSLKETQEQKLQEWDGIIK